MDDNTVVCPTCGVDIWEGNILFPCVTNGVNGHNCPHCEMCVPDLTAEQEEQLANWGEPPEQTAEEAEWENKAALVEEAVLNAQEMSASVDELLDANMGGRSALLVLRRAISDFLEEFDPDMDDGHSMEDLS